MRSATTWELLRTLGIKASHSRPRVSNDNPHIESLFKTVRVLSGVPGTVGICPTTPASSCIGSSTTTTTTTCTAAWTGSRRPQYTMAQQPSHKTRAAARPTRPTTAGIPAASGKPPFDPRSTPEAGWTRTNPRTQDCHRQLDLFRMRVSPDRYGVPDPRRRRGTPAPANFPSSSPGFRRSLHTHRTTLRPVALILSSRSFSSTTACPEVLPFRYSGLRYFATPSNSPTVRLSLQ